MPNYKFREKTKMSKLRTKNAFFGYFWARISKTFCDIWNQHPRNCLIVKFCQKMKMPKLGTKNALFRYFWVRNLNNYCHIWNQHLRICQTVKFREKIRMPKFGTKNALCGYFWARILKNYCYIWNQNPQFVISESLTHTVNFGVGSSLSRDPGQGPLFKVCHDNWPKLINIFEVLHHYLLGRLADIQMIFNQF